MVFQPRDEEASVFPSRGGIFGALRRSGIAEAIASEAMRQAEIRRQQGNIEADRALRREEDEARLRVEIEPDLPIIQGDHPRLVEVMQNLVQNAVKFMGHQSAPHIEVGQRGYDNDGKPILFVSDNGIGIEPEYHERIFGLFNRLDPSISGTGVGLTLVRRIIEVHGGRIWVESELGKGATFLFTLPLA